MNAAATNIYNGIAKLVFTTKGENRLVSMVSKVAGLDRQFTQLGVTTIFIDRLIQSFTRAWKRLNDVLGLSRIAHNSEELLRMATYLGTTTSRLQRMTAAGAEVGMTVDDLADSISTFAERLNDAKLGKGPLAELGIATGQFGDDPTDNLIKFLRLASKLPPADRLAYMEKVLGGDQARKWSTAVADMGFWVERMKEAEELGQVISEENLKRAAAFRRSMRRTEFLLTSISNTIGTLLIPVLSDVFALLNDVLKRVGRDFAKWAEYLGPLLRQAFDPMLKKAREFVEFMDTRFMPIGEFVGRMFLGISSAARVLFLGPLGQLLGKAALVVAVIGALGAVFESVFSRKHGQFSGLQVLLDGWAPSLKIFVAMMILAKDLVLAGLSDLGQALKELVTGAGMRLLLDGITFLLGTGAYVFASMSKQVLYLTRMFNGLAEILYTITDLIALMPSHLTMMLGGQKYGSEYIQETQGFQSYLGSNPLQGIYNAFSGNGRSAALERGIGITEARDTFSSQTVIHQHVASPDDAATATAEIVRRGNAVRGGD